MWEFIQNYGVWIVLGMAALPAIRTAAERLKTDGPIAAVVGPVVDDILAKLTAFAA